MTVTVVPLTRRRCASGSPSRDGSLIVFTDVPSTTSTRGALSHCWPDTRFESSATTPSAVGCTSRIIPSWTVVSSFEVKRAEEVDRNADVSVASLVLVHV